MFTTLKDNCTVSHGVFCLFVWVALFGLGFCFVFCCFSCALSSETAVVPIPTEHHCPSSPGQQRCSFAVSQQETVTGHRMKGIGGNEKSFYATAVSLV